MKDKMKFIAIFGLIFFSGCNELKIDRSAKNGGEGEVCQASKFEISFDNSSPTVNDDVSVTVKVLDSEGQVVSGYEDDVSLTLTGSATGKGAVDIQNGSGTRTITDTVAEIITVGLSDSGGCLKDTLPSSSLTFSSGPGGSCDSSKIGVPGAMGAAFGTQSLDLSNRTLSKTLSSNTSNIFAGGTPEGESISINWSGRRVLEFGNNDAVNFGLVERGLANLGTGTGLNWKWESGNEQWKTTYDGTNQGTFTGAATDVVALVVDGSTGDVEFWKNGVLEDADSTTFASGDSLIFYKAANSSNQPLVSGASTVTTVRTKGEEMAYSYNGADDWCGNAIPAPTCTITLEAPGVGSAFGASAMDVNEQVASITLPSSPASQYSASLASGLEIGTFTGRRAVEHINSATGSWTYSARGFVNDPPSADAVWRWVPGSSEWRVVVGGTEQAVHPGAHDDATAVVLVDNGDVEFWHGSAAGSMTLKNTFSPYSNGDTVKAFALTQGGTQGDSTSTEFKTSGYSQSYNGADNWCGNAIP